METLNQYLIDYMAGLTWLDYVDSLILAAMAWYVIYRVESKINKLVQDNAGLAQSSRQSLQIIDEQDAEIQELRKKYQTLHSKQVREVAPDADAVWQDWPRNN